MKRFKPITAFLLSFIMIFTSAVFAPNVGYAKENIIYLDATYGDDTNDGTSEEKAVKTFDKAKTLMSQNGIIKVKSFDKTTGIVFDKAGTLEITEDLTLSSTSAGKGITLKNGTHLKVSNGKTLTMKGYQTAIVVEKGAEINDGNYKFIFDKNGFAFDVTGNVKGSEKGKLNIDISNGYFKFNSIDSILENSVLNQKYGAPNWQLYEWNGFKVINSEVKLYRLPVYLRGPLFLDNSTFSIDGGSNLNYQTGLNIDNSWSLGQYHITNNSLLEIKNFNTHWRSKGMTVGYDSKVLFDNNSKLRVINNGTGGLNVNQGQVVFKDATLEAKDHTGAHFAPQDKLNTFITFSGNSLVETPAKDKVDNGLGQTGTNYIVLGGSHLVKYDSSYYSGKAIPVNGKENANEKLSLFTLADSSVNQLNVLNKLGNTYTYDVAKTSSDGEKHVWVPAAKVTFQLNELTASFSDGTSEDKDVLAIRGCTLSFAKDVNGNKVDIPKNPTSASGKTFDGWFFKDGDEEKSFDFNSNITKDLTVYAKWSGTATKKVIAYDLNNGSSVKPTIIASEETNADKVKVLSFEEVQKVNPEFKTVGKDFTHWSTDKDGQQKVEPNSLIDLNEKDFVTLYANWETSKYTIKFSSNGGKFSESSPFKAAATKDKFIIETDENEGEIATVKEQAEYGKTLSQFLNSIGVYNISSPNKDMAERKYHSIYYTSGLFWGNTYYWYLDEIGNKAVSSSVKISDNAIYYIKWKIDDNVENVDADVHIKGDIWSESKEKSSNTTFAELNRPFSITGAVETKEIKDKMQEIEKLYPTNSTINLSELSSSFTSTLTIPEGINIPENIKVISGGMNDVFKITNTKVDGRNIVIDFELQNKDIQTYSELKEKVFSTDEDLTVKIDGFTLDDKTINDKELTVTGEVTGTFKSFASVTLENNNESVKLFTFDFIAKQNEKGKDEKAKDDSTIQHTFIAKLPEKDTLSGDILIGDDTEHDKLFIVEKGQVLDYTGRLEVKNIKEKINLLAGMYDKDLDKIDVNEVTSDFYATFTVPNGLEIPNELKATLSDNELFEIKDGDITKEKNKIVIKMTLKKNYSKFVNLQKDVNSVSDKLDLTLKGIKIKEDNKKDTTLTVLGEVKGTFRGFATLNNNTKLYLFEWTAVQDPDGKDFNQNKDDNSTIAFTVLVKEAELISYEGNLKGDILIGDNTEHTALKEVKSNDLLEYTGRLNVTDIKNQITVLKENYGKNTDSVSLNNIESTFIATFTVPNGLEIPNELKATLSDNELFEIKDGDITKEKNKIVIKMTLKKNYSKFNDLYDDVLSVSDTLDLKIPNIKVSDNLENGTKLKVVGTVEGYFKGFAKTIEGNKQQYDFKWTAVQDPDGKDFDQAKDDDLTIAFTVIVKNPKKAVDPIVPDPKPDPENPKPDPNPNPDPEDPKPQPKPTPREKVYKLPKTSISITANLLTVFVSAGFVLATEFKRRNKK